MKARTLISFCQRAPRKPSHAESVVELGADLTAIGLMSLSDGAARQARPEMPRSAPVCRAITSSSFVGTTQAETRLPEVEMRGACAPFAAGSMVMPSHADAS